MGAWPVAQPARPSRIDRANARLRTGRGYARSATISDPEHDDLWPGNFLVDDDTCAIID